MSVPLQFWAARAAATLALVGVPLHVAMFAAGHHDPVITTLMVVMTGWCALCAVQVWRGGRSGSVPENPSVNRVPVTHLWVMAAAMAVLHAVMLAGPPGLSGGHHGHGGAGAGHGDGGALMVGIIALELVVGLLCAAALRRSPASRGATAPRPALIRTG